MRSARVRGGPRHARRTASGHPFARTVAARLVVALVLGGSVCGAVGAVPASAAACVSPVRYAASTNTIYLVVPQVFTLADIKAACAAAPVVEVDPVNHVWQLNADLVVQNGATLLLHGTGAAAPGEVNTLRLRSLASNRPTEVSQVTAMYGTIDVDSVSITSWDDAAGGPDTDPSRPAGSSGSDRGRAFMRALSVLGADGTPLRSRMSFVNSDVAYLGYYDSEAYGVTYKARGCDRSNVAVCEALWVTGEQRGSRFHDNYMGTYTWGAKGMVFSGNRYDHNVMYGLDPHDVSRDLVIDGNRFDYNGYHGLICSQLCDNLTITNNEADHNGMVPFRGPYGDSDNAGLVHGIMIHRGVTNTTISGNNVHDQPNGAGVAIFDSAGNTVVNNTLTNNLFGVRLSGGAANNTITGNTINDSIQFALFTYRGVDPPSYTTPSGRPTGNVFSSNTVNGAGTNGVKLIDSDSNTISNNTFTNVGPLLFQSSAGNVLADNSLPPYQRIQVTGSAAQAGSLTMAEPRSSVRLSLDAFSSGEFTSATGRVFSPGSASVPTTATPTGSSLRLTSTLLATTDAVTVTRQPVTVVPAAGSVSALAAGTGSTANPVRITITGHAGDTSIKFAIKDLSPNTSYRISRNGRQVRTVTTDGTGRLVFTDTPPTTDSTEYVAVES